MSVLIGRLGRVAPDPGRSVPPRDEDQYTVSKPGQLETESPWPGFPTYHPDDVRLHGPGAALLLGYVRAWHRRHLAGTDNNRVFASDNDGSLWVIASVHEISAYTGLRQGTLKTVMHSLKQAGVLKERYHAASGTFGPHERHWHLTEWES